MSSALYGVEAWTRYGEGFSVYFNLFSRLSVLERREHRRAASTNEDQVRFENDVA